ncbi:centriolar and ciliogenesis-associated protein HYLS1 isoform X1 [Lepisosteus oculatus]|uniref:HYLS1 centriolar and ciliogenesis associated n=1 Tax=Lepisosteus oculatus TaxID=7918 RepID=W5NIT9_LEPOC|nr:PREDICTED: hydrolethalus syndrome protein 1 isoform X1 [Lepisosteus oculatus]XP_015218753.1 PREDICTED: hydrolethalus syndrome protein 1 isoform X1 [Lepisosteus oculatus]XP_015218754.1 PREDICTED: hydrolethalus syndrome protein 1 isoform X1 [Lepisosteus oculatus]
MEDIDFTEDEIEQQLAVLGYSNIPRHRLREFKQDLEQLIRHERSKSQTSSGRDTPQSHSSAYASQAEAMYKRLCAQDRLPQPQKRVPFSEYGMENQNNIQQCEPYIRYSVAPKLSWPASAPYRPDIGISPHNSSNSASDTSRSAGLATQPGDHGKPVLKRKVLRKQRGQVHVFDESTESRADSAVDVGKLEEELDRLQLCSDELDSEVDSEETSSLSDKTSSEAERVSSAFQVYRRDFRRSASENDILSHPKSFIRPQMNHPHTRNLKKTDPVSKYFQYKQDWDTFRAPGEKDRKGLRWGIREQMLYKSQAPPKPQRIYVPNTYVVPTEKKRSALRWEVRHDLANGIQPPKIFYPF